MCIRDSTISYVAPYTGTYYIDASWYQGSASSIKFVYLSVLEDVDTLPIDSIQPTVTTFSPADEATSVAAVSYTHLTLPTSDLV